MTDGAVLLSTPTKSQQQEEHSTVFKLHISIPLIRRSGIISCSFLCDTSNYIFIAATGNPWEVTVVVFESVEDDNTDYNSAGFSLVSQQKGCYSAYGGDTTQEI